MVIPIRLYISYGRFCVITVGVSSHRLYGLQSVRYLLFGSLQKKTFPTHDLMWTGIKLWQENYFEDVSDT